MIQAIFIARVAIVLVSRPIFLVRALETLFVEQTQSGKNGLVVQKLAIFPNQCWGITLGECIPQPVLSETFVQVIDGVGERFHPERFFPSKVVSLNEHVSKREIDDI
jgi:hypothetical protein